MSPNAPHPAAKDQPAEGGTNAADGEDDPKPTPTPDQAERNREDDPPV